MRTIYKYPIAQAGDQTIFMPQGAKILHVEVQNRQPCLWALVETTNQNVSYPIMIRGTGHAVPDDANYVGTMVLLAGVLVLHVFWSEPA